MQATKRQACPHDEGNKTCMFPDVTSKNHQRTAAGRNTEVMGELKQSQQKKARMDTTHKNGNI